MQKVKAAAASQADNNPTVSKVITKEMAERRRLEKVALEVQKPWLVLSSLHAFGGHKKYQLCVHTTAASFRQLMHMHGPAACSVILNLPVVY